METQNENHQDELSQVLSALVDVYETQNQRVVTLLHREVLSNLTSIKLIVNSHQADLLKEIHTELIQLLTETSENLHLIHNEAYPKLVKQLEFGKVIKSVARDISSGYEVTINHQDNIIEKGDINLPVSQKINLVRLFKAIILNLICEESAIEIQTSVAERDKRLYFKFSATERDSTPRTVGEPFMIERIDSILARLMSQQAEINEDTDWVTFVEYSIPIEFNP